MVGEMSEVCPNICLEMSWWESLEVTYFPIFGMWPLWATEVSPVHTQEATGVPGVHCLDLAARSNQKHTSHPKLIQDCAGLGLASQGGRNFFGPAVVLEGLSSGLGGRHRLQMQVEAAQICR